MGMSISVTDNGIQMLTNAYRHSQIHTHAYTYGYTHRQTHAYADKHTVERVGGPRRNMLV